jgi:hypothetical protein
MKSWKTSALVAVALVWGTSAIAAQPIRASQSAAFKSPAAALSIAPRAGAKLRKGSNLDGGPLTLALIAAAVIGAYFFYTEVIDDDDDSPASP